MKRQLAKKQALNSFLLDLHSRSEGLTEQEIFSTVIEEAVRLTDSSIGFLHQVSEDQSSIVLTAWNREALRHCTAVYDPHYMLEKAGNWVDCVRQKRPLIYNNYAESPNQKGVPTGHVQVKRLLSIPVMEGDGACIVVGVGNKDEEYDEHDADNVHVLANEFWQVIKRQRAETLLRLSEQRHITIFNAVNDAIFIHDAETGMVLDVNEAALRMYGFETKEEFIKSAVYNLSLNEPPYSINEAKEFIRRASDGVPQVFEWHARKRDGKQFWAEVALRASELSGQKSVIATVRDISSRKLMEQERRIAIIFLDLINARQGLTELVHAATTFFQQQSGCEAVGIRLKQGDDYPYFEYRGFSDEFIEHENSLCIRDKNGNIEYDTTGNPVIACMCGNIICGRFDPSKPFFTRNGSFWSNCTTELLASTSDADRQARTRNRCNGEGYESVALIPLVSGEERLGLLQLNDRRRDIFNPEIIAVWERLAGYLAVAISRTSMSEQLAKVNERLTMIQDSAGVGSWDWNLIIGHTEWSPKMFEIFGLDSRKREDLLAAWNSTLHPEDRLLAEDRVQKAILDHEELESVYRIIRPDGAIRYILATGRAIYNEGGTAVRMAGLCRDITESRRMEDALDRSEARYLALFDSMTEGLALHELLCDSEGRALNYRISSVNPAYTIHTGIKREKAEGSLATDLYQTDDPPFLQKYAAVEETGIPVQFETYFPPMDKYFKVSAFCPSKGIFATVFNDITPQKRAENALREQQQQLYLALDSANMGVWQWDIIQDRRTFDDKTIFLLGIDKETFRGTSEEFFAVIHPEDRQKVRSALKNAISNKSPYETDYRAVWPDSTVKYINARGSFTFDEGGAAIRLNGLVWDVTEKKRSELERQKLTAAIEQVAEALVITDIKGDIQYVNPAFTEVTGYSREEVLGQNPRILKSGLHDEAFYKELWGTISGGRTWTGRIINRRKDSTLYTEEATISPVRDSEGKITGYIAAKRDISKELSLEAQLMQAQKMEAIGTLAGGIAHDFNNVLQAITSNIYLLKVHGAVSNEIGQMLDETDQLVMRASDMTRGLLSFSRRQVMTIRHAELNEVIEDLAKIMRRMLGEDIVLDVEYSDAPLPAEVDVGQIQQVLVNLAVNARDAMPKGGRLGIELRLAAEEELAAITSEQLESGFSCITVSDTGIGMERAVMEKIFDPFFTTKETGKGTGLGLAMVYGIIKQHRGYIEVDSIVGRGTKFMLYLPLSAEAGSAGDKKEGDDAVVPGCASVFAVDDEEMLLLGIKNVLTASGYKVTYAMSGKEALKELSDSRETIDLLLVDLVMPEMNGRELAEHVRVLRPGIKILYMSGYPDNVLTERDLLAGGIEFIAKPFSMSSLSRKIREMLGAHHNPMQQQ